MQSHERQAAHKARKRAAGLVQVNVWLPEAAAADMRRAAEIIRQYPRLTIGRLLDPATGRLVGLRNPKVAELS
jgi:hypothetical protein